MPRGAYIRKCDYVFFLFLIYIASIRVSSSFSLSLFFLFMFRNLAKTVLTRSNFTKAAVATSLLFPMSIVHAQGNKDHHDGNKFKNPWPSFEPFGFASAFKMLLTTDMSGTEKRIKPNDKPETVDIDWNLLKTNQQSSNQLTVTWLGQ